MSRLPMKTHMNNQQHGKLYLSYRDSVARIVIAAMALMLLAGILQASPTSESGPQPAQEFSVRQGPAEMTSSVDRSVTQIAEKVQLTLSVVAPQGITVSFPGKPVALGAFDVTGVSDKLDIPLGDKRSWTRVYELESFISGTQEIPEIAVAFTDKRSGTPKHDVVTSQPISVTVTSVLEGQADPTKFRDLKGAVDLPITTPTSYTAWWIGSGIGLTLAALLLVVALRKRRQLTADQWALAEMDRLIEEQLIEQGRVQIFYSRLADIVRIYIERRFKIAAPRLTTEEFLEHLRRDETLIGEHGELLRAFLQQADIVKFASYQPATSAGNEALETARSFVQQTAPTGKQPETIRAAEEV